MKGTKFGNWILALVVAAFSLAAPAHAGLIVGVDSVLAPIGSSGSLNVTLTNNGPGTLSVGGFSFVVSTTDTDISFLSADNLTTDPYVFASTTPPGTGLNFIFTTPGQSMDGSDASPDLAGILISPGTKLGLGRVLFQIAPGATLQVAPVTLDVNGATSVSSSFNDGLVTYDVGLANGQITVATPEPTTLALLGVGLAGVFGLRKRGIARR